MEYGWRMHTALDGTGFRNCNRNFKVRVLICAVARRGETIIPSGDFTLRAGDKIYLTAATPGTGEVLPASGRIRARASSVMIVGASKMCYYLASELLEMGMSVKIIDQNEQRCVEMSEKLPRALVIVGDGTDSGSSRGGNQPDGRLRGHHGPGRGQHPQALSAAKQSGDCCKVVAKINRKSCWSCLHREPDRQCGVHRCGDHRADPPVISGHEERLRLQGENAAPHRG